MTPGLVVRAERAGAVVGIVHFVEQRTCWSAADVVCLQDLFTAPEARGQGVRRTLIARVGERARALGCAKVHWLTHETNTVAMALYDQVAERPGFVQYRIRL